MADYIPPPVWDKPGFVAKADPALLKAFKVRVGYPLRGNLWTGCQDWTHLTRGEHAGQFPTDWLKTLTPGEVQSLHSDAHEGRVHTEYVPKAGAIELSPAMVGTNSVPTFPSFGVSNCPNGQCPQQAAPARWRPFR